ncbi:MAG: hypothetical protein KC731_24610, partial [Myxococcales bacterium]|nr:hypothetical protein [Myxococcales bacterium]
MVADLPPAQVSPQALERAARIAGLAALLSLDVTAPFLAELTGLSIEPARLQTPLRALILDTRRRTEAEGRAPTDFEARFRAMLEQALDAKARQTLWQFIDDVYYLGYAERPHWNGWQMAFKSTGFRRGGRDALALGDDDGLLNHFAALSDTSELRVQIDQLRARPPSEWDLEIYVRRSWDPRSDVGAPFRVILDNILLQRFRKFMQEVDRQLDDDAQD